MASLLPDWKDIVNEALTGVEPCRFGRLLARELFTDGFKFPVGTFSGTKDVERFLRSFDLDVRSITTTRDVDIHFVMLEDAHQILSVIM